MKMSKKEFLIWGVLGLFVFGLVFGLCALADWCKSKPKESVLNLNRETDEQSAIQTQAVAEAMSYYSKKSMENLEALSKELGSAGKGK